MYKKSTKYRKTEQYIIRDYAIGDWVNEYCYRNYFDSDTADILYDAMETIWDLGLVIGG